MIVGSGSLCRYTFTGGETYTQDLAALSIETQYVKVPFIKEYLFSLYGITNCLKQVVFAILVMFVPCMRLNCYWIFETSVSSISQYCPNPSYAINIIFPDCINSF